MLGTPVSIEPALWRVCSQQQAAELLIDPLVAAVLESGAGDTSHRLALDVTPLLAAVTVDRALGGDGKQACGRGVLRPDELSRGVLAYVIARLLHASTGNWRLREIVTRTDDLREALGPEPFGVWPLQVRVGTHRGTARFWLSEQAARALDEPAGFALGEALLGVELDLVAVAGSARLKIADLWSLGRSDVLLLDRCRLLRENGEWSGEVNLEIAGGRRTRWTCAVEERTLRVESVNPSQEQPMTEGRTRIESNGDELMKMAGDAPIEVSVELARFKLPLQQLAELRKGEILLAGRPLGESVTVRAAGRAVATGELVDVDGEVGVRITATG
jgi:type III secretion system YscQ/HrcQ family protein